MALWRQPTHLVRIVEARPAELLVVLPVFVVAFHLPVRGESVGALRNTELGDGENTKRKKTKHKRTAQSESL